MALGNFVNVVAPFEYLKHNLPTLVHIQQQYQANHHHDTLETARNIRTIKKLYGKDFSHDGAVSKKKAEQKLMGAH